MAREQVPGHSIPTFFQEKPSRYLYLTLTLSGFEILHDRPLINNSPVSILFQWSSKVFRKILMRIFSQKFRLTDFLKKWRSLPTALELKNFLYEPGFLEVLEHRQIFVLKINGIRLSQSFEFWIMCEFHFIKKISYFWIRNYFEVEFPIFFCLRRVAREISRIWMC